MAVKRVVPNVQTAEPAALKAFYGDILGMEVVMDMGWIVTFASDETTRPQISFATQGGSGTELPAISIEVDDFDEVLARVHQADLRIEYGPVVEAWGVRRFFLRDPAGQLVNILTHL